MRHPTDGLRDSETGRICGKEIWARLRSAFAVLLSVGVLAAGGGFVYQQAQAAWEEFQLSREDDYTGTGEDQIEIEIVKGATLTQIGSLLQKSDIVKTTAAFSRETEANADSKNIQAGRYKIKKKLPAKLALAWLLDKSHVERDWMTLTEGARLSVQVNQMVKATKVKKQDFEASLKNWKKLGLPKWAKNGADGFLFPDTYELPVDPTADKVLKQVIKQFNAVAKSLDFENQAKKLGYTPYEVLIVASIMEREVFRDADRPKVARVIYNRLKIGMPLELDSTVAYAVNKTGTVWTTKADRNSDSPYNTYKFKGLPPGPISSPARKALDAALHPADGKWLFFMPVNLDTGETWFSDDNPAHEKARAELQKWCKASEANRKKCA